MRIPAYPLITVDPFFSIRAKSEKLYDSDTELRCEIKKRLTGEIEQKECVVLPYTREYGHCLLCKKF